MRHDKRLLAIVIAIVASVLVVVPPAVSSPVLAQTAGPTPGLSLAKSGPGEVLAGDAVSFSLTTTNAGPGPAYNVSFRDVLPLGVTYAGPTTPAPPVGPGDPTILTNKVESPAGSGNLVDQQTLIWGNVTDLQPSSSFSLSFAVNLNETPSPGLPTYIVGSTLTNSAEVYGSSDARVVPAFTPQGAPGGAGVPVANPNVGSSSASSGTTTLTAIKITKSEPSPEGELLRGVHDFTTVYTLTVDVTDTGPVTAGTVTDYLPASIEFLGCGGPDNGIGNAGQPIDEYPGPPPSGPLGGAPAGANCRTPLSVETVQIPPQPRPGATYPPGVYTKVTWELPTLTATGVDANAPYVITYAAGIPMFENALEFRDVDGVLLPTPPAASGRQGSNLDNNNGPSTREDTSERAATNIATVTGRFDGPRAPGTSESVESEDRLTRSIEDVRMRKTASTSIFDTGKRVTYTVKVDVSEYTDASGIRLGDLIPNGLCPIDTTTNYVPGDPVCAPDPAAGPTVVITSAQGNPGASQNLGYQSVVQVGGAFDVAFDPIASLTAGESATVTYSAGMRATYGGTQSGPPTVSGDSFTNSADLSATTEVIENSPESAGPIEVEDGSQASVATTGPTLQKLLLPRSVRIDPSSPTPCPTDPALYVDPTGETDPAVQFRLGDKVCFLLQVNFSTSAQTRNADVGDFLPVGVDYVTGSMTPAIGNTIPAGELGFTTTDPRAPIGWLLGAPAGGTNRYVDKGAVFRVVLAGEVKATPDGDAPQLKGNLMKMRTVNTAGQASSFRDDVPFRIVPPPPLGLIKGVESVNTPAAGPFGPNTNQEGQLVQQGSQVRFRIDLTNDGTPADFNDFSARNLDVLDLLPPQVNCGAISAITNFGTNPSIGVCSDPNSSGYPIVGGTRSVIRWNFDGTDPYAIYPASDTTIPADLQGTRSLFYTMTIPPLTSVSEVFLNDAGVRSYGAFTNITNGISPDYFPENNIDPNIPNTPTSAPAARDTSFVQAPGADVEKFVTSWIEESDNNRSAPAPTTPGEVVGDSAQAVVGEYVTYRYFVDIPARTTVFNGDLTDQLPTPDNGGFVIVPTPPAASGAPAGRGNFYAAAGTGAPASLPSGVTFDPAIGAIDFGATYTNTSETTQRFEAIVSARVIDNGLGATNEPTRPNTASFVSTATPAGPALTTVTDGADVQIRQPVPTLVKSVSGTLPNNIVQSGDTITYTLTASNEAGRPPLHDSWIVDCIPAGLEDVSIVASIATDIGPQPGGAANGCDANETYVAFLAGSIAGGASVSRSYTARVSTQSVGNEQYVNDAVLTGSSLNDGKLTPQTPDNPNERTYRSADSETVTVLGAGLAKSVSPGTATIGETVTFTLREAIPANTNFYQAAILDRLPDGLDFLAGTANATCTTAEPIPQTCSIGLDAVLGPVDDPSTTPPTRPVAFYVGDISSNPVARVVTITYNARVRNIAANADGGPNDPLVNAALPKWDLVDKNESPITPLYPWQAAGRPASASVDIIEPRLTIVKSTPDLTVEPGQAFDYSIVVRNAGTSTAFNTVITDTIPAGIDLLPGPTSPDQGGVVSGKTITWLIPSASLDPTEQVTLTYRARLVPSAGIDASTPAANFTNNATVTRYTSLANGADPNGRVYTGPSSQVIVTPQFPRLTTTKTRVTADPVYIGEPVTWRIVTTNQTPAGTALTTTISDTLPPNWTFGSTTSITGPGGTITPVPAPTVTPGPGGDTLVWTLGTLAPGQNYTVVFTATPQPGVDVPPALPATFTNRTTSTATDGAGSPGNQAGPYTASSSATARIDRVDLAIDKSHTNPPVAGSDFSWSIVVRNNGPSQAVGTTARPFTVVDTFPTLPAGVTFASASGTGWSCAPATGSVSPPTTGTVTCSRTGTLNSGASFPAITFTVRIPSDTPDGTRIANTATVGGQRTYERTTDLVNNTDTDEAIITTRANLQIVKTLVDPPGLVAGTNATYNLAISNLGPSTSRATTTAPIVVRDTLPPNVTFVSATDTAGTPTFTCTHDGTTTGGVVTCNRTTDILLNAASNIRIVVSVPSGLTGSLTNTGTVTPPITTDPTPGNNTSTVTNPIVERADLGVTKTALGPNVPGEPTTYRLSVTNNGPGDATVRIQDTLPAGLTYRSFSNVAGNWTCTASTAPDPVPGFRCDLAGKLTFTSPTLNVATVDVLVDTAPSVNGTVRNIAVVSTTAVDTNPTNNTAFADLTFAGVADLAVTKTATNTPVIPGGPISWTVNVSNLGPSDSQPTIRVDDQLPVGVIGPVTAVGVTGADGWTCTVSTTRFVSCTKATKLAAAGQTNIRIAAVVDPATPGPTSITNAATVFPTTAESKDPATTPNTANNTGTATVTVAEPAVTLTKAVNIATPQPGQEFTYTITLTNAVGASPAYDMKVSDVLPAGIVWVSGGTVTGNTVNWTVPGPLAGGASTTVSFVAKLAASPTIDTTAITNVAKLDSFESLPTGGRSFTGNSDDTDITPVFPTLTAAKSALGVTPTYLEDEFAWEITITNTGQGDAAKVDVTDLLPRNWTYVANSTTVTTPSGVTSPSPVPAVTDLNADPAIIDQQLVWLNLGVLKPGQSLTVAFRAVPTTAVATNPGVGSTVAQTNRASAVTTDNTTATGNKAGDYGSNTATATARIDAADLEIRKLNAATPAIAGENYSWTLKVRNLGDDPAVGPFTVVDTLPVITPTPLTFVSATGTGWACGQAAGVVTCTRIGTLPAPTVADDPLSAFPDITVTVAIPSDYLSISGMTNAATVDARTYDPATANNTATAVTPVSGLADLEIAKRRADATITAGSPITYQLDVSNNGPSTSRGTTADPITVIDTLPANTTFVSASTVANGDAWNCTNAVPAAGKVTCTLASDITTTAPAQTINITVNLASGAPLDVDVVNNAEVRPGATAEGAVNPNDPTDPKIVNNFASDTGRPIASADLVMDKRSVGALVPGSIGVYRLHVDNEGPSDANAPTITDTLPPGLTFAGFSSNPAAVTGQAPGVWTSAAVSADLRTFSCTLDRPLVTPGFSVVDIDVDILSTLQGPIENTSTVTSTTPDPITGNNTDSDNADFTTLADLAIVKTGPTAPVVSGTNFDWTLTVTNNGPSVSRQPIQVFDALPDSVALVTDVTTIGAPWSCTSAPATVAGYSTVITCTLAGDLPSVAPANVAPPITFAVRSLPAAGPATITNRSAVKGTTDEPADKLDNNLSNHDVVLIDRADVQIAKSPASQNVRAGENATFSLAVTNNGPSTADNVLVTDPLPSGMTITLPFTATGWDCSASTTVLIDCERPSLDPGPAPPITVVANVASSVLDGTKLVNTATVATSSPGDLPGNNTSSADVIVGAEADLTITKTHPITPDPVAAGTKLEFQMVVTNDGPSDSVNVVVTDTLPDGFSYLSVRGPWTCTPKLVNRQVIDCTKLGGGLAAGATADPLFILTQLDPNLDADVYTNVAEVSSNTKDPNTDNNKAEDDVNVGTVADVSIVKSHDPDTVRIGENLVFTLAVSNVGPSEARDVLVTDTLPVGLTLVSASGADDPSTWDCSATTGQSVSCRLVAPLGPKTDAEDILVTALVEPAAFPGVSNTADVVTSTEDSNTDNNTWTDDVVVPRLVDLFITKTHAEPVGVGKPIVYTLTVGNNGPIDDDAVITVTDPIPTGLRATGATSDDADCSITDGLVTCTKDDGLAVAKTFTINVTADVLAFAYPTVTNTAEVSSPTDDKDLTNNKASDTAVVPPLVDLAITKTHTGAIQVGGKITYTVTVRNNGPTPDPGPVRMLDTLPGSLTPVSATADGMTCAITGQTVTCQALAPLAVNAQLVITIVADVGPAAYPSVSNTAIVTTPGCSVGPGATADTACPDTDLRNNAATDVAEVAPLILLRLSKTLASQEGLNATWNFVVANGGLNATIQPIVLTDALPSGLVYVSAQGEGWACANAANVVTCTYPAAVAAGATASPLQIVTLVTATGGSEIVNVATVNGGGPEVPSVTDDARVIAPPGGTLPTTGGGGGRVLLQTAPMLLFVGLVLTMMSRGRRRRVAMARPMRS